jgi:CAAD domains of cyanobacterial aminoacyl-tRNA synthetase
MEAQQNYMEPTSQEAMMPPVNNQSAGNMTRVRPDTQPQEQWQQYGAMASEFLAELPDYLGTFFNRYKQPLISLGLIFAAIIAVKVVLAVIDALNDIPLLAPTFELIGISYSAWFVYRYLLRASNRQELSTEIETIKAQIVGAQLPGTPG